MSEELLLKYVNDSIPTYASATNIVREAEKSHKFQWELYKSIRDHLEGKKPIPSAKLKKQGLSWASNWNYGKGKAQIEKNVSENVRSLKNAMSVGSPEFVLPKEEYRSDPKKQFLYDINLRGSVSSTIGYCFARAIEEEGDFYVWANRIEYFSYTFGYSPVVWKENTWVPDPVDVSNIAFPPGTTAKEVATWVIFRTERAIDLYDTYIRIRNKKTIQKSKQEVGEEVPEIKYHWNEKALGEILTKLYSGRKEKNGTYEDWADILPLYTESPGTVVAQTEDLNIAAIHKVEANGDITVVYIPRGYDWYGKPKTRVGHKADDVPELLYKRVHKGKEWKDLLRIIQDSAFTNSGDIHSSRGAGKMATENSIRYNRLRNSMNNKSELIGSPMFEQPSTQTAEKVKITHSQGFTLLQPGFVPIEHQPNYDIQSHLAIMNAENREFSELSSHYDVQATGKLSSRPTSDEVQLAKAESAGAKVSKEIVKLRDYSGMFYHIIQLMADTNPKKGSAGFNARRKFFKLLKQNLPDICEDDADVKDLIKLVDGYTIDIVNMSISSLQTAMQLAETPYARNRIKRMMLVTEGFSIREINIMVPIITDKFRSFDDTRVALIENDMFWTTNEVSFSETDDHVIHYENHSGKLDQVFDKLRAGELDVVATYEYTINLYTHILLHVDALLKDPVLKGQAEDYLVDMKGRKKVIDQISYASSKEVARREEEAKQNNPGISPKDQHDMRLKSAQAQAQEQRNQFKTQQRGSLKEQELEMKHSLAKQEMANEHKEEMAKILLENQRETIK